MSDVISAELFVEDDAHRQLIVPVIERIGRDEGVRMTCRVRNARGGHPRAMSSFKQYQVLRERGVVRVVGPTLLVVAIDGNCSSFAEARRDIQHATREAYSHSLVVACPDPHIERWYVADPQSFEVVVGTRPRIGPEKCHRDHYKQVLATAVQSAGHPPTLGGIEFAGELAEAMDFFRAGRNVPSLKAFIKDLRAVLRTTS